MNPTKQQIERLEGLHIRMLEARGKYGKAADRFFHVGADFGNPYRTIEDVDFWIREARVLMNATDSADFAWDQVFRMANVIDENLKNEGI
jgi:hypothetical protein